MKTRRQEAAAEEEQVQDVDILSCPTTTEVFRRMSKRRRSSTLELGGHYQAEQDSEVLQILEQLSNEELETAARASYEYVQHPSLPQRDMFAARICRRYLDSKQGDVELATQKVKKTLHFREDYDVEGLMKAFDDSHSDYATNLQKNLSEQKFFVQGYDKEGRSTLFFIPRNTRGFDKEWHLKEALYSIERAIACSKSQDHTINAVVDFSGFSLLKHSPPIDIGKEFLTTLRSHYAGQINKIFLLDCPTSFSMLWKVFSPFVGTNTRSKIQFVTGEKNKAKLVDLYDLEEMPSFMCPKGGKNRAFDLEEYLFELKFDEAFDETLRR